MSFVADFIHFPAVQKVWKSVKMRQSYREFKGGNFLRHNVVKNKSTKHERDHTHSDWITYHGWCNMKLPQLVELAQSSATWRQTVSCVGHFMGNSSWTNWTNKICRHKIHPCVSRHQINVMYCALVSIGYWNRVEPQPNISDRFWSIMVAQTADMTVNSAWR